MLGSLAPWLLALSALPACTSIAPAGALSPMPAAPVGAAVPAPPANAAPAAPDAGSAVARYRCEQNIEFTVRFADDSATIDAGSRGREVLLRDAGGATPQQTVYSNARMRAEFGLGMSGRDAIVRYALPPLAVRCVME